MTKVLDSARELLDATYSRLGFDKGDLLSVSDGPDGPIRRNWVEKGDWLSLAKRVGAERIFFVDDYPVIVFAEQRGSDKEWIQYFNSVWCMARPQVLFLARQGELCVFNLTKKPARDGESPKDGDRLLDLVRATADIQDRLHQYRREEVESGRLFEDHRFGFDDRADRALVRDLSHVRTALINAGLEPNYAHALIGRSIFIRYLEDRGVLTPRYFQNIAKNKESWCAIVNEAKSADHDLGAGKAIIYPYVLTNKAFTYQLFTQLASEFKGDMFPIDPGEQRAVRENHLKIIHRFLLGNSEQKLFFYAYRFDIIPIELISSIYEKFYSLNPAKRRDEGSYYTPSALAVYVLSETLTESVLSTRPRVVDPACGSGIFLVEAFRRIVRHRASELGRSLMAEELRDILQRQIAGMDISSEAIRVAAFSLYLAMLNYLDPPDILLNRKLPWLTYSTRPKTDSRWHFDILIAEDAFRIGETVAHPAVQNRFLSECADVIIGNPPWGAPLTKTSDELLSDGGISWCEKRSLSVGDRERSQTFVHRAMDMLRPGGRAGLLLSTGVFFKRHERTKEFRRQWLQSSMLNKVVNFAAVRDAFFQGTVEDGVAKGQGAIAPFAAVFFEKRVPEDDSAFVYWSAKESAYLKCVQAVILNRSDMRLVLQRDFMHDDSLWKIYWWGGHRDEALINRLRIEPSFKDTVDPDGTKMRVGFQEASRKDPAGWLKSFKEFPTKAFQRYGELPIHQFIKPPNRVHRRRSRAIYEGPRILIKRGVDQRSGEDGRIAARFETEPFCFRDSIHCAPVGEMPTDDPKIVLAILWSSLTRYYLFLTSGTWGLWHDEVKKDVIYSLPVRFPEDAALRKAIIDAVDELRALPDESDEQLLFSFEGLTRQQRIASARGLEQKLDALIYDLFQLSQDERDRVTDLCTVSLDFFYKGMNSQAVLPVDWPDHCPKLGRRSDIPSETELSGYLVAFLEMWEPHLEEQAGHFRWRVIRPKDGASMLAVVFEAEGKAPLSPPTSSVEMQWELLLQRLSRSSLQPSTTNRVYIDGLIRIVADTEIVIIKRNERRLWTRSAARDDAEATMVMAMNLNR